MRIVAWHEFCVLAASVTLAEEQDQGIGSFSGLLSGETLWAEESTIPLNSVMTQLGFLQEERSGGLLW